MNTLCLLGKGALVRTMTHAQEFLRDKIKCEVADKLCMASHAARRKREHQYNLHQVFTHGILGTRLRNIGYELYVLWNKLDQWSDEGYGWRLLYTTNGEGIWTATGVTDLQRRLVLLEQGVTVFTHLNDLMSRAWIPAGTHRLPGNHGTETAIRFDAPNSRSTH